MNYNNYIYIKGYEETSSVKVPGSGPILSCHVIHGIITASRKSNDGLTINTYRLIKSKWELI